MKYKNSIFVVVFLFLFAVSFADVANAQIVKDKRRAISLGTCVEIGQLPQDIKDILENSNLDEYEDNSSLNGMSLTTVRSAGWSTKGVWNERPANKRRGTQFCFSVLDPNAEIYTLNGDKNPQVGYLTKCLKDGKRTFMNRIIVPTADVVYKDKIVEKEKVVYKDKIVEVKKDCPECPDDANLVEVTTTKERFIGGLKATGVSAAVACGISGIMNKSFRDCAVDAAISAGASRAVQAVNPSPNAFRAYCDGENRLFKKGKGGKVGSCELEWEGSTAVLKFEDQECKSRTLGRNFNTTVFAVKRGEDSITPRKTQTTSQPRRRVRRVQ